MAITIAYNNNNQSRLFNVEYQIVCRLFLQNCLKSFSSETSYLVALKIKTPAQIIFAGCAVPFMEVVPPPKIKAGSQTRAVKYVINIWEP